MSWKPLAERFAALPLILAGPILRRAEPRAVTVWLALKAPQTVTLCIYARDGTGNLHTMYLFAWSDVLWPDDLPFAESSHASASHQSMQQKEKQEYTQKEQ